MQPYVFATIACVLGFTLAVANAQTWVKMISCLGNLGENHISRCAKERNISAEIAEELTSCSTGFLTEASHAVGACFTKQGVLKRLGDPCFSYFNFIDELRRNRGRRSPNSFIGRFGVEMVVFMDCLGNKHASFEADVRLCDSFCKPPTTQQKDAIIACSGRNSTVPAEVMLAEDQALECALAIFNDATRLLVKTERG